MYGGQMVEFGTSEDIFKNPKHPYTQALLESIPRLHGNKPKYIKGVRLFTEQRETPSLR